MNGSELGPLQEMSVPVSQRNVTLARLDPRARYRFHLRALTRAGQGEPLVQEGGTVPEPGKGGPPPTATSRDPGVGARPPPAPLGHVVGAPRCREFPSLRI